MNPMAYYPESTVVSQNEFISDKEENINYSSIPAKTEMDSDTYKEKGQVENDPTRMDRMFRRSETGRKSSVETVTLICSDPVSRSAMSHFLNMENINSRECTNIEALSDEIVSETSVFLVDLAPMTNGVKLCQLLSERYPDIPVIYLDEPSSDIEQRKTISRLVFSCIVKPCDRLFLLQTVRQALRIGKYVRENRYLRQTIGIPILPVSLVGISATMQTLRKQIEAFGRLDNTILISGERGTGRSTIAQQIHLSGPRSANPFMVVSCNALPQDVLEADLFGIVRGAVSGVMTDRPGRIELAHHGTIFLDHIESLSASMQKRLFQFLQEKTTYRLGSEEPHRIDTRIIASTSSDLAIACVQGRFRDELYFRLNALTLNTPSLRDRTEDIPSLSREILSRIARASHRNLSILSTAALNKLRQYSWPGNIRELDSVLQKAVEIAPDTVITENDISFDTMIQDCQSPDGTMGLAGLTMAEIERRAIIETINASGGNRAQSARKLGVSEKTIYNKIKQFKLRGIV